MTGLEGARCAGRWWLFDSTDRRDHIAARQLCAACPAIDGCRELLKETSSLAYGGGKGGYIQGTWAGQLFGRVGQRRPRIEPPVDEFFPTSLTVGTMVARTRRTRVGPGPKVLATPVQGLADRKDTTDSCTC